MLSLAAAVNDAGYYLAKDNYYFLGNMEARWMGEGAAMLGLEGRVHEADFAQALAGRFPGGGDLS